MSELVFVGTSDAFGAGGRRQSAILLRAAGGAALLDCGITTNTGLAQLGISRDEVDAILISHFHGDHFGGIPLFLLAAQYEDQRARPLRIAGPAGIEARVRRLADAMGHPLEEREPGFEIRFDELPTGQPRAVGPVSAELFAAYHQPATCPHGMLVQAGSQRVAYSGDTGWFDDLPARVAGADVFVCECTLCTPGFEYHLDHQTLCERRDRFDCGRFVLTHLGTDMRRLEQSDFEIADDGMRLSLASS